MSLEEPRVKRGLKALLQCLSVPDHELASQIIQKLIDNRSMTVRELADALDVSYALVLRVVNDLAGIGVIETGRVKPEGRGRARKLVSLNLDGLREMVEECKEMLKSVEELIARAAEARMQAAKAAKA